MGLFSFVIQWILRKIVRKLGWQHPNNLFVQFKYPNQLEISGISYKIQDGDYPFYEATCSIKSVVISIFPDYLTFIHFHIISPSFILYLYTKTNVKKYHVRNNFLKQCKVHQRLKKLRSGTGNKLFVPPLCRNNILAVQRHLSSFPRFTNRTKDESSLNINDLDSEYHTTPHKILTCDNTNFCEQHDSFGQSRSFLNFLLHFLKFFIISFQNFNFECNINLPERDVFSVGVCLSEGVLHSLYYTHQDNDQYSTTYTTSQTYICLQNIVMYHKKDKHSMGRCHTDKHSKPLHSFIMYERQGEAIVKFQIPISGVKQLNKLPSQDLCSIFLAFSSPVIDISNFFLTDFMCFLIEMNHFNIPSLNKTKDLPTCQAPICLCWSRQLRVGLKFYIRSFLIQHREEEFDLNAWKEYQESKLVLTRVDLDKAKKKTYDIVAKPLPKIITKFLISQLHCQFEFSLKNLSYLPTNRTTCKIMKTSLFVFHSSSLEFNFLQFASPFLTINWNIANQCFGHRQGTLECSTLYQSSSHSYPLSLILLNENSDSFMVNRNLENGLALHLQNASNEKQSIHGKKKNRNHIEMKCTIESFHFTIRSLSNTIDLFNFIHSSKEFCNNYPRDRVSLWDVLRLLWLTRFQKSSQGSTLGFQFSYSTPVFTKLNFLIKDVTIEVCTTRNIKSSDKWLHNKRVPCFLTPVLSFQTLAIQNKPFDYTSPSMSTMFFDVFFDRVQVSMFANRKSHTGGIHDTATFNKNKIILMAPLTMKSEIILFFFKFLSKNLINIRSSFTFDSCQVYLSTDILRQLHYLCLPKPYKRPRALFTSTGFLYRKKQYDNGYLKKFHIIADILYPFSKKYSQYLVHNFLCQIQSKHKDESSAPLSATLQKKTLFSILLSLFGRKNYRILKSTQITISINTLLFCATKSMSTQSSTFNQTPSLQPSFVVYFDLLKCESTISKGTVVSQDKCLLPSRFHCIFNKFFLGVLFRDFSQDTFNGNFSLTPPQLKTFVREKSFCCTILSPETPVYILLHVCANSHLETDINDKLSHGNQGMENCCNTTDSVFLSRENNVIRGRLLSLTCCPKSDRMSYEPAFSLLCYVEKVNNLDSPQVYKLNATLKIINIVWNLQMRTIGKVIDLSFSLQQEGRFLYKNWTKTHWYFFEPCKNKTKKCLLKVTRQQIKQMAIIPFLFLKIKHNEVNIFTNHVCSQFGSNLLSVFKNSNDELTNKFSLFLNEAGYCDKCDSKLLSPIASARVVDSSKFQLKTRNLFIALRSSFQQEKKNFVKTHFSHLFPTVLGYQLIYALKEMKFKLNAKEFLCYTTINFLHPIGPYVSKKTSLVLLVPQNRTYGISCAMAVISGQKSESLRNDFSSSMSVRLDVALGQLTVQVTENQFHMLWYFYLEFDTIILSLFKKQSTIRHRRNTNVTKKYFQVPWEDTGNSKVHIILNFLLNSNLLELKSTKGFASVSTGKVLLNLKDSYIINKRPLTVTNLQNKFKEKSSWYIYYKKTKATLNVAQTLVGCQGDLIDTSCKKKYALLYAGSCSVDYSRNYRTNNSQPFLENKSEQFSMNRSKSNTFKEMTIRLGGSFAHSSHCSLREEEVAVYLIPAAVHCFFSVLEIYLKLFRLYTRLFQNKSLCFSSHMPHVPSEDLQPTNKTYCDMHITLLVQSGMIYASTCIPLKDAANVNSLLFLVKGNETEAFLSHNSFTHCKSLTHSITFFAIHNDLRRLTECIHISCRNSSFWRPYHRDIIFYRQWKSSLLARSSRAVLQQENVYAAFSPRLFLVSQHCQEGQSGENINETIRDLCIKRNSLYFRNDKKKPEWGLYVAYQNNKSQETIQQCTHIKIDIPLLCRVNYLKPVALTIQKAVYAILACFAQTKSVLEKTCDGFFDESSFMNSQKQDEVLRHDVLSVVDEKNKQISENGNLYSYKNISVMNVMDPSDVVLLENDSTHLNKLNKLKRTIVDISKGNSSPEKILKEIDYCTSFVLLNFYLKIECLCVWISSLKDKKQTIQSNKSIQSNSATGFCLETKINCNYNCNQVQLMDWVAKSFENLIILPHFHFPQWIIKTSLPLSGSLSINVTECAFYIGNLQFPCVTGDKNANSLLIETFPCSETFFSSFFKHANNTHGYLKNNPIRIQRTSTFSSTPSYLLSFLTKTQTTDYKIQDISMCHLLEDVFEASISLNFSNTYIETSSGLKNRKELNMNIQCTRVSAQLTINDLLSFKILYQSLSSFNSIGESTENGIYTNATQILPSKKLLTNSNNSVIECFVKLTFDQSKGVKADILHSNLETLASFQFEQCHLHFNTIALLKSEDEKYSVKFSLMIQRFRLSIPCVKQSVVLAQNISSFLREKNSTKRPSFFSHYSLHIVESLYHMVAIMEVPTLNVEINAKPGDTSITSMQFHIEDTVHFNVCPESIQWLNNVQKLFQEWNQSQIHSYYIKVDERCFSSWLRNPSSFLQSRKNEISTINNDIVVPFLEEKKDLPFILDALSWSFEKDGVNLLFKVQDLRQVVNTKKNLNNFTVMIEKESPFKAVDKSNNNSTTKQLVSECFLLSNHDSLLSSFETFNKIQSSKTKTKFQQGNIKTKYHILFQQFYIQIRNTLNIPLYISVERENLDSNFNSWSFCVNKESNGILPEFASENNTTVSFCLDNKLNKNWSDKYVLKDLLQCSRYVPLYDSNNTHVTCVVGLFCLNTNRNTERLFSSNRSCKALELRISAPLIIKNMLPRSLYCTMIQDEMKIEAIVEPFLTLSVTNLNPAACILLSQIKFENDSKDDSYESFHVLPLRPYMKNVNDSTNLINQKKLTVSEQHKNVSFNVIRVVDGSSIQISYTFEVSQAHLHISALYWIVNLTKHLLQYTPICFNDSEDETHDYLTDRDYPSISLKEEFLTNELNMRSIQLYGCPSYTEASLQNLTKRSLEVQSPVGFLASSPFRLLSTISKLSGVGNVIEEEKKSIKPISSTYPSFCTEAHNAFKLLQDEKHFTSGRLTHRNNRIMQEAGVEEEKLIFDNGQVLILQSHHFSIESRKVTLLLFLPTHLLINNSPRALYVRQTQTPTSDEGNSQLVPSGCIKQLHWFTKHDEQHGFQVCDASTIDWSPLISLGDPQKYAQPLPSFFPLHLSPSLLNHKKNTEENTTILFINSQLMQGVILVDVSTPYVVSTLSNRQQSEKRIPTPPLIVQNNLHLPLYIHVQHPVFGSKYITKVSSRSEIPFWVADTFENSPTLFEISVQSLFFLTQKGAFFSLKEVDKEEFKQFKFMMMGTGRFPLRSKPFSFDKEKSFTGVFSLNCINETTHSFLCICRYAYKISMIFHDNVKILSIDGVYCFFSTPFHRIPSIYSINHSLSNCQGFLASGFMMHDYQLFTNELDVLVLQQRNKSSVKSMCISYPQLFSQNTFGVSNNLQKLNKDVSLIQHIFYFLPSCTCTLTFFQIAVSVSPLPYEPSQQNHTLFLSPISNTKTSVSFFVIFSHINVKILWREMHSERNESLPKDQFLCRFNTKENKSKVHILATLFAVDILGWNRPFFDSSNTLQYSDWLLSKEGINTNHVYPAFNPHILGRTQEHTKHHEGLRAFSHFLKKRSDTGFFNECFSNIPISFSQISKDYDNVLCLNVEFGLSEKVKVWTKENCYIQWNTNASSFDEPSTYLFFFDGYNILRSFLPYALTENFYDPIISFQIDSLSIQTLPIELQLNYTWMYQCFNEFCFLLKEQCYTQEINTLPCSIENETKCFIFISNFFQIDPVKIKPLCTPRWSSFLLFKEIKLSPVQFILSIHGIVSLIHFEKANIHWKGQIVKNVKFQFCLDQLCTLLKDFGQEQLAQNWYNLLLSLNFSCQPIKYLKMWSQHIKSFLYN